MSSCMDEPILMAIIIPMPEIDPKMMDITTSAGVTILNRKNSCMPRSKFVGRRWSNLKKNSDILLSLEKEFCILLFRSVY